MLLLLVPFGAALVLAYLLTPLVIYGANKAGVLDVPSDDRRAHSTPVPRLGGVAVLLAVAFTCTGIAVLGGGSRELLGTQYSDLLVGLCLGTGLIFLAGLIDDIRGLSARLKLIIQTTAALVVAAYGLAPSAVAFVPDSGVWNAGPVIGIGVLVIWIVGITNAFNLIDGLDGLASSFAIIAASVSLGSVFIVQANLPVAIPIVLVGATLGFLRYNWSPARVFLGDTGSMTLGFVLSILTVITATDARGVTYPIIPLFALAFPITDTLVAIARRWVRGVSVSVADGRHIHHQLRALGLSVRQTVQILTAFAACVAGVGLLTISIPGRPIPAISIALASTPLLAIFWGIKQLNYDEFSEFKSHLVSTIHHTRLIFRLHACANEAARKIRRAHTLNEIREILDSLPAKLEFSRIELIDPRQCEEESPRQSLTNHEPATAYFEYKINSPLSKSSELIIRFWSHAETRIEPQEIEEIIWKITRAINS